MSALDALAGRLRASVSSPPGLEEIRRAARSAAARTDLALHQAGVPAHCRVINTARGARVEIVQTGPLRKRFAGRSPRQLLSANITSELDKVRPQIAESARRVIHG